MVEQMRTNVLKREEKGFGPVSFPRILLAGFAGVFAVLALGRLMGFVLSCVSGFILVAVVLIATQPISGTPLAQYLAKTIQGIVVVNAVRREEEDASVSPVLGFLITAMNVSAEEGTLACDEVFEVPEEETEEEGIDSGMVFFRDITDLDAKGLQVVENPFGALDSVE